MRREEGEDSSHSPPPPFVLGAVDIPAMTIAVKHLVLVLSLIVFASPFVLDSLDPRYSTSIAFWV
jgi:hypothetical protein